MNDDIVRFQWVDCVVILGKNEPRVALRAA